MVKSDKVKANELLKWLNWLKTKKQSYSSFPELDPKNRLVCTSLEPIHALRISSRRFYSQTKKQGLSFVVTERKGQGVVQRPVCREKRRSLLPVCGPYSKELFQWGWSLEEPQV